MQCSRHNIRCMTVWQMVLPLGLLSPISDDASEALQQRPIPEGRLAQPPMPCIVLILHCHDVKGISARTIARWVRLAGLGMQFHS